MRWSSCGSLVVLLFTLTFTYYTHAKSIDDLHSSHSSHHPSLSIAGDPKDVKLKASIDQLVRALQYTEKPKEEKKPNLIRRRITPAELITKKTRNLYYGDNPAQAIPDPITVSSQPIQITGANGTGGKRGRSLTSIDKDGVKTIEGIRVPDNEEDKHYTWRNARVIKGFLVPNDRSAQPHRKRQIAYADSSRHYLAQQGSTLIDSAGYQPQAQAQTSQSIIYQTQPQAQTQYVQQDLGAATIYTTANNPSTVQYQSGPGSATILTTAQNIQAAYPQYQQQQGQMYVLQEGTNTYVPYNPVQASQTQSQSQFTSRTGEASPPASQTQSQTPTQAQQLATTAEQQQQQLYQQQVLQYQQQQQQAAADAAQAEAAHAVQQAQAAQQAQAVQQAQAIQQAQAVQQAQAAQQAQIVQQQAQIVQQQAHVIQHHEQPAANAVVPQESQRPPQIQAQQVQQAPVQQNVIVQHPAQSQQQIHQQNIQISQAQHQAQYQQQQQIAIPQGATVIQTRIDQQSHDIGASPSTQYIQLQQQPGQTVYQIQTPASSQFSERQSVTYQQSNSNPNAFVIQPQTYVTGPGGQMFTVPVPIPAEQAHHDQQQQQQQQNQHAIHSHHQQQQSGRLRHDLGQNQQNPKDKNVSEHFRDKFSLANRLMQSFQFNRKTMENVERNAVVPALASTGLFLGLGALAAGWYLSKANREVGIVRRSGRPVGSPGGPLIQPQITSYIPGPTAPAAPVVAASPPPAAAAVAASTGRKRSRRSPQTHEVDQATFFQSIIQQSLEKQQQKIEDTRPVYSPPPQQVREIVPEYNHHQEAESSYRPKHSSRNERIHPKYSSSREDDYYTSTSPNSKVSKQYAQEKSGWSLGSAKNFAKVAVPAVILGGAIIGMAALIFGWYISGTNREIAFLEPAAYSRRKRSLTSTALSDGWLQRVLTSIHGNPYENLSSREQAFDSKSVLPHPFIEKETSKTSDLEFKISNGGLAGVLAGGAIIAVLALGLASSFSETSRQLNSGATNIFGSHSTNYKLSSPSVSSNSFSHLRVPRSILTNELNVGVQENPGFLGSILQNLEVSQTTILNKLQEAGYTKWQETPCAKRIFCDVMSAQSDDSVSLMEKRMATVINLLPKSMSSPLSKTLGDLMSSINRRDCSAYSCGGHWVDPSIVDQPSPPANQPR